MVDIKRDKYILGQSDKKALNLPGEEIRLDLNLSLDGTDSIGGIVTGVVQDSFGIPIKGALIKLMSTDYNPIMHAVTDLLGKYTLNNVPVNTSFKIYAIAPGKKLKEGSIIAATLAKKLKMDFTLEPDPSKQLAVIAGDIFDFNSKLPVGGAVISLYSITGSTQNLIAVTDSNKYGQFTFREVAAGSFNVVITAFGYYSNTVLVTSLAQGQIIPLKVELTQDPNTSKGTVSGVIKDDIGNPIDGGDVILYRVEDDDSLTPVAFTKTNSEGVYLFENVTQATYKIKSNESTIVTVVSPNSPLYYGFTIANSSTLIPKVTEVSEANLYDGAQFELDETFVTSLGGVTGGKMEIGVTPDFPAYFDLSIKYLSGNADSTIILKENPDNDGEERTIKFDKTDGWEVKDAKTITIRIPMHNGQNRFKLFNNENELTPWIGDFSLIYVPYSFNIEATTGTIANGALNLPPFITQLGGPTNGEVNIPIKIPFPQPYKLKIRYLSGDEDRPLKLDIEGENQASVTVLKTNDWALTSARIHELKVEANEGENNFKFYNDTGDYAPNISTLSFSEYTVNKTFLPKDVVLLDGLEVNTDISGTDYIDGVIQGKGEIKFTVTVFEDQLYDFKILYKCEDDRVCNVKVNDNLVEYQDFEFKVTGEELGEFYGKIFLTAGENTIQIYNA